MIAAGAGLMYWGWQPRGREEGLALGIFMICIAVPLLLYAIASQQRRR
jgi:hypothetical protein